jgi:hypothetical protein
MVSARRLKKMWPLKKSDGPGPELEPHEALDYMLLLFAVWCAMQAAFPWMGSSALWPK